MKQVGVVEVLLVPLDGSQLSKLALPVAEELAERLGATALLMSAVRSPDELRRREAELAAIRIKGGRVPFFLVLDHDPAGAIHEALRIIRGAMVCMATHGRGRSAALVGSVAVDFIARAHEPAILVGPLVGWPKGVIWEDEPVSVARFRGGGVVTCVDDTPSSTALVALGLHWAKLLTEPMTALTVAEAVPPPIDDRPVHRLFGPDGDVDGFLERLLAPARGNGVDVNGRAVYDPIGPSDGVNSYLEEQPAALVVLGSHTRLPSRVGLGSVAAGIVRRSPTPVLVAPMVSSGDRSTMWLSAGPKLS
jgi:nucleotide-binding universal stress UspA family protein